MRTPIPACPPQPVRTHDVGTRRAEGLDDRPTGLLAGEAPPEFVEIEEHGTRLYAELYRGQKTGFFLDQRANRSLPPATRPRSARAQPLLLCERLFCPRPQGGASRTLDVDISPQVVPAARHTLAANRPQGSHSDLLIADVFPFVDELADRGPRYDMGVCDPLAGANAASTNRPWASIPNSIAMPSAS